MLLCFVRNSERILQALTTLDGKTQNRFLVGAVVIVDGEERAEFAGSDPVAQKSVADDDPDAIKGGTYLRPSPTTTTSTSTVATIRETSTTGEFEYTERQGLRKSEF